MIARAKLLVMNKCQCLKLLSWGTGSSMVSKRRTKHLSVEKSFVFESSDAKCSDYFCAEVNTKRSQNSRTGSDYSPPWQDRPGLRTRLELP